MFEEFSVRSNLAILSAAEADHWRANVGESIFSCDFGEAQWFVSDIGSSSEAKIVSSLNG